MKQVAYKGVMFYLDVEEDLFINRTYISMKAQRIGEEDKVRFGGSLKNENKDS